MSRQLHVSTTNPVTITLPLPQEIGFATEGIVKVAKLAVDDNMPVTTVLDVLIPKSSQEYHRHRK